MFLMWKDFIFCCILGLLFTASLRTANAQSDTDLPDELGTALGIYRMNVQGKESRGFGSVISFQFEQCPGQDIENPIIHKDHTVKICGSLVTADGDSYKFKKALLRIGSTGEYEGIMFDTMLVDHIRFSFRGRFLKDAVEEFPRGPYTNVRGVLVKYSRRKKVASQQLPFYEDAEM